jgi:hypothetical protein
VSINGDGQVNAAGPDDLEFGGMIDVADRSDPYRRRCPWAPPSRRFSVAYAVGQSLPSSAPASSGLGITSRHINQC